MDFVSTIKHKDIKSVQSVLKKYNLLVNEEKTEYTDIKREQKKEDENWRKVKKVGSLLGDEEDMARRRTLAAAAMGKMDKIWIRQDKISNKRKINIYRALVKSILLYNCGSWVGHKDRGTENGRIPQKAVKENFRHQIPNKNHKPKTICKNRGTANI